jgi:hypothetical protein
VIPLRNQRQNYHPFCLARYRLLIHERLRFSWRSLSINPLTFESGVPNIYNNNPVFSSKYSITLFGVGVESTKYSYDLGKK